jgi:hypothetical protein
MTFNTFLAMFVLLAGAFSAAAQSAGPFSVTWSTVDGGSFSLSGTIGQPDAISQPLTSGIFSLTGGFWSFLSAVQTPGAPRLAIRMTGPSSAVVFWPSPSTGFSLQQSSSTNPPSWTAPLEPVTDGGTNRFIIVNSPIGNRFYRLKLRGLVVQQIWTGVTGTAIDDIPLGLPYDRIRYLDQLESPPGYEDLYGTRLRAVITAPTTGSYTFWIASDENGELRLSTDETSARKRLIASVPGWASFREWSKYTAQRSEPTTLIAGQRYYVEALMKQHGGTDHLSVGWARPGEDRSAPSEVVPSNVLSPYL